MLMHAMKSLQTVVFGSCFASIRRLGTARSQFAKASSRESGSKVWGGGEDAGLEKAKLP